MNDLIRRQDVLDEIVRFSTEEGASVECSQLYCDVHNMPNVLRNKTNGEVNEQEREDMKAFDKAESEETETWNGIHAQITAPKGTFERIWNNADKENEE